MHSGEAGKVEESMAKLAAVDALKTLKQEKEVGLSPSFAAQTDMTARPANPDRDSRSFRPPKAQSL
jgi:hypothetical protein